MTILMDQVEAIARIIAPTAFANDDPSDRVLRNRDAAIWKAWDILGITTRCDRCNVVCNIGACHHCPAEAFWPCIRCKQPTRIGVIRWRLCPECLRQ